MKVFIMNPLNPNIINRVYNTKDSAIIIEAEEAEREGFEEYKTAKNKTQLIFKKLDVKG